MMRQIPPICSGIKVQLQLFSRVLNRLLRSYPVKHELNADILNTNQYDVNMLYHFGTRESKARPYFLFGMGATKFQPHSDQFDISSVSKFNLGFGGGVKAYFTDHFGIRGELRYTPTYLSTTADGIFCIEGNGCYVDEAQNWLNQLDFTVGTIFRF